MKEIQAEIGRVVYSRSGRDKGNFFLITAIIDKDYVLIADGKKRKIDNAKKKKIKHIKMRTEILEGIAAKIKADKQVFDSELASALRPYNSMEEHNVQR